MIVLYTTHCPKCVMLEKKMNMKGLTYTVIDNEDEILEKGFTEIPVIEADGEVLGFREAVDWINSME